MNLKCGGLENNERLFGKTSEKLLMDSYIFIFPEVFAMHGCPRHCVGLTHHGACDCRRRQQAKSLILLH